MSIINVPEFNISSFSIGTPMERHQGGYGSVVKYNGEDIILQTPLCKVEFVDYKEDKLSIIFKLSDNFEYFQFFCSLHELIVKNLCRYAGSDKYKILSSCLGEHENIRKKFTSYVIKMNDTDMIINLKLRKSSKFFERTKQSISGLEVKRGDYVVCMIKANQISMDEETSTHTWDCIQCLRWRMNSKTNLNSEDTNI
jgi:hypothetical protein